MVRDELSVLSAFLAVAEERSFTRAAKRMGVTPSALSHAIRELEERLGVRLLARTTRSVAPTDAGAEFLARVRPALGDVREALELVSGLRDRPAGHAARKRAPALRERRRAPGAPARGTLLRHRSEPRSASFGRANGRQGALPALESRGSARRASHPYAWPRA